MDFTCSLSLSLQAIKYIQVLPFTSFSGEIQYRGNLNQRILHLGSVTEGGLRAISTAARAQARRRKGLRLGTAINWPRTYTVLSAYTWMRTERGPQKA